MEPGLVVALDRVELESALYSGILIDRMSREMGLRDYRMNPRLTGLQVTQLGQVGERAVAKALDLYWSGAARTFKQPDLTHNVEVRVTTNPKGGVKVRREDADTKRVVGCVILPEDFTTAADGLEVQILGWIQAGDAKQGAYWVEPYGRRGYYSVPADALTPLPELRRLINQERMGEDE